MRAVVMREFGPPEVLVAADVPDPVPGPGQVLIDVGIANITFVETQVRAGRAPNPAMVPELPAILGNGVGGVVGAVGAEVHAELLGRRVITSLAGTGGYAEQVVANAAGLIAVPGELDLTDAVALLADRRTAMLLLRDATVRPGETVLVEAAAGAWAPCWSSSPATRGRAWWRSLAGSASWRSPENSGRTRPWTTVHSAGSSVSAKRAAPWTWSSTGWAGQSAAPPFDLLRTGGRSYAFGMASGAFTEIPEQIASQRGVTLVRGGQATPEELREMVQAVLAEAAGCGRSLARHFR